MSNYGSIIAKVRKEKGMTQAELAELLFISPQAVSKWENGLSEPDLKTLEKLSEIFDKPIDFFFGKETDPTTKDNEELTKDENSLDTHGFKCTICEEIKDERYIHQKYPEIVCSDCFTKEIKRKTLISDRATLKKAYIKYGVLAGLITITLMILGFIGGLTVIESLFGPLLIGLVTFSLLVDYKHVGPASDVLSFFSRGITMPGIIFDLSIDGIIFLILVKVLFGIISILISIVLTIIGVTIAAIVSLFSFIPLIVSNHKDPIIVH